MRYAFAPVVAWQSVNDEAVVLDLSTRHAIGLNPAAAFVWTRIEAQSVSEIVTDLSAAFKIGLEKAGSDVSVFLGDMHQRGLIERLE
ncbi:MAG: hypothetical protein DRJ65_07785 [Acidobacteria bacterium]|nr:MAG: hypothetical protein DRJ65_07785 [Acidobacteriota bacterium]